MKKKTVMSLFCTLCWLLAAYAAYAFLYFAWLTATPLSESQLKRAQYDAMVWLVVLVISLVSAPLLGWWRLRFACLLMLSKKKPKQSPEATPGLGPS
jgi:hypothetical protein